MMLSLPLILLATLALAAQSPGVDDALSRAILATEQTRVDTQVWTASRVPVLRVPASRSAWETQARTLRQRVAEQVGLGGGRQVGAEAHDARVLARERDQRLAVDTGNRAARREVADLQVLGGVHAATPARPSSSPQATSASGTARGRMHRTSTSSSTRRIRR